ncbi:arginase family protein [Rhizobium leguminosarum]|uniref:Arginase n=1 Tax=Rhizobium leguminosarum TaxID=384 RepID=A0ABD7PKB3_RHILE|nr:arginase family protein [Rhizobium leguminosarum]TAV64741.1 arginase [Rhizobium leguminosarum]TAV65199.1 arginase [Rhizobium leguminosarum]TAW25188.1 arginase [Rhizobium leguminosarum]TAW38959.1 arginase [Rhizobium leguminosarum]TAY71765.1 arginase [Rhizobium leguminosarum]
MQLLLLHLDDALELQPDFVRSCMMAGAHEVSDKESGSAIRLWGRRQALDAVRRNLAKAAPLAREGSRLCFMGSGDFHHVTALLLSLALERCRQPVTVIHIDNHPDWVHFDNGMHCGSWINKALEQPLVKKVITLGVCSHDLKSPERKGANLVPLSDGRLELYPYMHPPSKVRSSYGSGPSFSQIDGALHWQSISELGEANFVDKLLGRIQTETVYITIDKDVLSDADAVTNWDQGCMQLTYVLWLLREIGEHHRVIGADVTGDYSTPQYGGDFYTRTMKKAEVLIDQPFRRRDMIATRNINSAANHALLEVLSELMP